VNSFELVRGKRACLLGIGLGRELEHWAAYGPESVLGLDVLNYAHAWCALRAGYPNLDLAFRQVPPNRFDGVADAGFDILSSENVFEHVRDLDAVLGECARILRPGGLLFSSFGPLWFTWSGDHFAATREDGDGFAHLRNEFIAYKETCVPYPFGLGTLQTGVSGCCRIFSRF
jgi:SAM-dependent methyltransferase